MRNHAETELNHTGGATNVTGSDLWNNRPGCLPGSTAVKSVPANDLVPWTSDQSTWASGCMAPAVFPGEVRLTYRTAYSTGVAGRIPADEDRGENFAGIHNIGRKDNGLAFSFRFCIFFSSLLNYFETSTTLQVLELQESPKLMKKAALDLPGVTVHEVSKKQSPFAGLERCEQPKGIYSASLG